MPARQLIPDWNDLRSTTGGARPSTLHATNNFPSRRSSLPGACRSRECSGSTSCRLTIKSIEQSIVDRAFDEGWIVAEPPASRTGKRVAVVGIGPCRAGRGAAVESRGPRRDRVRARRPDWRAASIRDSRVQDGKAVPEPPARPARSRGRAALVDEMPCLARSVRTSASPSPQSRLPALTAARQTMRSAPRL